MSQEHAPCLSHVGLYVSDVPKMIDFSVAVSMAWHRRVAGEPAQSWFRSLLIDAARE